MSNLKILCSVVLLTLFLSVTVYSQTTWNATSGNWSTNTNWAPNTQDGPSGAEAVVNFTNNIGSTATVNLDLARTAGILNVGDTNGSATFTISGSSVLTMDNGAAAAQINYVATGRERNVVGAPMVLTGNLNITNSTALEQRLNGSIDSLTGTTKTITLTSGSTGILFFHSAALTNSLTSGSINIVNNAADGILSFSNDTRNFGGTITNNAGTIRIPGGGANAIGTGALVLNGGTAEVASLNRNVVNDFVIGGNVALVNGGTNFQFSGNGSLGSAIRTLDVTGEVRMSTGNLTGIGGIIKEGAGTLRFETTGSKQYTGGTTVNEGTLRFQTGSSNVFSSPADADLIVNAGGTVDILSTQNMGDVTLNGGAITGNYPLLGASYDVRSGSVGIVAGSGSDYGLAGSAALTKTTSGTVTFTGTNTYNGTTTVSAGTLIISSTGSINNSSAVTVAGGGEFRYNSATTRTGALTLDGAGAGSRAILSGEGVIDVAITLDNIGDTLSPGNSPGILPFTENQTWNSFTYLWETNNFLGTTAGDDFDSIAITGSLNLTGGLNSYVLDITSLTALDAPGLVGNFNDEDRSWTILTTTGGITGFSSGNWTLTTGNFTSSPTWTGQWSLISDGDDLILNYAIPEPGTALLFGAAATFLQFFRRRRLASR